MSRRLHYEQAFEHYLRTVRIPYVRVDDARKALLPGDHDGASLKSFDFVIYGEGVNLLADVKGRKAGTSRSPRLESWVTRDDVESLTTWEALFGEGFEAAFVFVYWCGGQPPDALFQEVFAHRDRWYALRTVTLERYRGAMRERSARWRTVDLPAREFATLSQPFSVRSLDPEAPVELPALHPHRPSVGSAS